jgi:hypothetical protein
MIIMPSFKRPASADRASEWTFCMDSPVCIAADRAQNLRSPAAAIV